LIRERKKLPEDERHHLEEIHRIASRLHLDAE
jgi:hypothetical protein